MWGSTINWWPWNALLLQKVCDVCFCTGGSKPSLTVEFPVGDSQCMLLWVLVILCCRA